MKNHLSLDSKIKKNSRNIPNRHPKLKFYNFLDNQCIIHTRISWSKNPKITTSMGPIFIAENGELLHTSIGTIVVLSLKLGLLL